MEVLITEQELLEKGFNINEYTIDTNSSSAVINLAYSLALTRISKFNDKMQSDEEIISEVSKPNKISIFKDLQYRIIYNLVFGGLDDPCDKYVDDIICFRLKLGAINGFQKSVWGVNR